MNDNTEDKARNIDLNLTINGVGKLTFELPLKSDKWFYVSGDNLITYKGQLYVVQIPNLSKSTSGGMVSVECHHIGNNLEGKLNIAYGKTDLVGKTIREIMTVILAGSGWEIGDIDIPDTTRRGLIVNEQSIMSNIKKTSELFDCSYIFDATLDYKKVHFRHVAKDELMTIREGVNMRSLGVMIDKSTIITRLLVSGANDEVTNRPITVFGATMKDEYGNILYEIDGITPRIYDKTYIEDYSYYINMGYEQSYIDAHPEYFLKESILNMSDYVDKTDLLFDAMKTLRTSAKPKIEVTFDMADKIDNDNLFLHTPELNEMVYVYSKEINEKLNIKTTVGYNGNMFQLKVSEIKINSEKPDSVTITAKNYSQYEGLVQTLISNAETINRLVQSDGTITTNRLQGFIDVLSTKLNSSQSHWYTDESGNLVFENVLGTEAMKLGGGIFGIANSKLPDGSWNWRTFGSGAGFTADMMNTGTLNADLVSTGILSSFDGATWIDLDSGFFNFRDAIIYDVNGLKINLAGRTIEEYIADRMTHSIHVLPAQQNIFSDASGVLTDNVSLSMDISVFNGFNQVGATITSPVMKNDLGATIVNPNIVFTTINPTNTGSGKISVAIDKNVVLSSDKGTINFVINTVSPIKSYSYSASWVKAKSGLQGQQGLQGSTGSTGVAGDTLYTWLKYADTPTTGISDSPTGKTYIGLAYNKATSTESGLYADYSWSLIKGDQGIQGVQGVQGQTGTQGIQGATGANGLTSYTHIAYSTSSTGATGFTTTNPVGATYIGMYSDFVSNDSITPSDYNWSLIKGADGSQGIQGNTGSNGLTSYLHIAYANSSDGVTGFSTTDSISKLYIGQYTNFVSADSIVPSDYSWTIIKGDQGTQGIQGIQGLKGDTGATGLQGLQGTQGNQGIQGNVGANGLSSYTHIAYATNATGSLGFSTSDSLNKTYIGMYANFTLEDSTNPVDYNWTLIKGSDGSQGIQGVKGTDGLTPYLHIAYASNGTGTTGFSTTDSVGKTYIGQYTDNLSADSTNPALYSWTLIKGDTGLTGATLYTWIKYADTPTTGMSDLPDGKKYLGIAYNKASATKSTTYGDYTWSMTEGIQGNTGLTGSQGNTGATGATGATLYTWLKYGTSPTTGMSDSPVGMTYMGLAYNKDISTESTTYADYSWSLIKGDQGVQGNVGSTGATLYTWVKYADTPTTGISDDPTGKKYFGIAYNKSSATKSLVYADYSWSLTQGIQGVQGIAGIQGLQGLTGSQGVQGVTGADGISSYTHIAYATSSNGSTGFSTFNPAGATYIGMYVDSIVTDSETPSLYNWTLIKGADGSQGIQGVTGANGQTSYLHIAYATNATGSSGFSTTDSVGKTYIGQYTDFNSADSATASLYSWSLIKGDQGIQGVQGIQGIQGTSISSVNVWYYLSTSATVLVGGTWATTAPTWVNGSYMWSKSITTYSNSSTTESTPVCITGAIGATGATGNTGNTGATGVSISSVTEYYLATASISGVTTATAGWTTTVQDMTVTKKFLWNYEVINFSNATTSPPTTPIIIGVYGDSGETGATGSIGATGRALNSVTEYYLASASSTGVTTATAGWTTTMQVTTIALPYLWNYEVLNWSVAPLTNTIAPIVIGIHGATGTGITSIAEEYYLSTSKTTQTGGSWVTTPPTWSTGMYMWTRSKIVYSNPVSTVYTTAIVDNAWEAVNEIQVGGRNFILNSSKDFRDSSVGTNTGTLSEETNTVLFSDYNLVAGDIVTFKVYLDCTTNVTKGGRARISYYKPDNTYGAVTGNIIGIGEQGYSTISWTVIDIYNRVTLLINSSNTAVTTTEIVKYKEAKLEKGNKATDWTPAPEDVDATIGTKADNGALEELSDALNTTNGVVNGKADIGALESLRVAYDLKVISDVAAKKTAETNLGLLDSRTVVVENTLGSKKEKWDFIETSVSMAEEGIFIGNNVTKMGVLLSDERISFMDKGTEVAYITGNTMEITHGIFVKSAIIGKHKIETIPNTNISVFTYVG